MTKQADLATTLWAFDVLSRYAPEPLTYEGRPLENLGNVVLATPETALELRHYTGDPAVDQFKRVCERDRAAREAETEDERMEREDRIEADGHDTDPDYLEYLQAQSGARRW